MTMKQIIEDNDEEDGEEVTYQGDDNGAIMVCGSHRINMGEGFWELWDL